MDGSGSIGGGLQRLFSLERVGSFVLALVCVAALVETARSYPENYFPRFWDEGIYTSEAAIPGALMAPFTPREIRYGPMKLGYALPLRGAFLLFGPNGFMYLSTAAWLVSILVVAVTTHRRIGALEGWFVAAFLTYSSLYGKFLAEASPTMLAGLVLSLLWTTYSAHRFWLTGSVLGLLAFIDSKWLLPTGLAILLIESLVERARPVGERGLFLLGVVALSSAVIGLAAVLHPSYWSYISDYVVRHAPIVGFEPSAIFLYYLAIFGAAPCVILAATGWLLPQARLRIRQRLSDRTRKSFYHAVLLGGMPLLFYSLLGSLKGLRFFAVAFPIFSVPVAAGAVAILNLIRDRSRVLSPAGTRLLTGALALISAGIIVIPSDGPARHLRMSTGISDGMAAVAREFGREGTISSYIWPVVYTRWGGETESPPFTPWGLLPSDRWLILVPMVDRVTIETRILLGEDDYDPDAEWRLQREVLLSVSESLFRFPAEFYSSDYHLCEQTVEGIGVLRQWRALSKVTDSSATVYQVDLAKSQQRFGWK